LTKLLTVEFLVSNNTISNTVSEKWKLDDLNHIAWDSSKSWSHKVIFNYLLQTNANWRKTMATVYKCHVPFNIMSKATHCIMELNSTVKVIIQWKSKKSKKYIVKKKQNKETKLRHGE